MRRLLTAAATLTLAGVALAGTTATASACACNPSGKVAAKNWPMDPGYVTITANHHATTRVARAVGNAWLDTSTWSPGALTAAGKTWRKTWSKRYGAYARTLEYANGRQAVTLYWSKYGAG